MSAPRALTRLATLCAVAALAVSARAQLQQCHTVSIPLQTTNWSNGITLPKFDYAVGTLDFIEIQFEARAEGSANIENPSPAAINSSLVFAAQLTLTGPGGAVLGTLSPSTSFADSLAAFDGTIDFDGPSGESHPGIVATSSSLLTIDHGDPVLDLFTGAPGSGETVTLPLEALGISTATGPGPLIVQFNQSASATVTVCYYYDPNSPPHFHNCPIVPLMASVGVQLTFDLYAEDHKGEVVVLSAEGLPPGAVTFPPLPFTQAKAVYTTVRWTPTNAQVGTHFINFRVRDPHGRTEVCTVAVTVAECHMLFALGAGNSNQEIFGHLYATQLAGVRRFYPVTMEDIPSFPFRALPPDFYVQVVMYNPQVFPANPSQWSPALRVHTEQPGELRFEPTGTRNGISVRAELFTTPSGQLRARFPFQIAGM